MSPIFVCHLNFNLSGNHLINHWTPIAVNRNAVKGILIGCALYAITHFTAYYTLINYATLIFSQTDTTLISPYVSTIIMAVALAAGSILSAYLADAFERRIIIIVSLIGCVLGLLSMGLYHHLYVQGYDLSSFRWVPTSSLSFAIFVEAAGIVPTTIVCSIENLPSKVKTLHSFHTSDIRNFNFFLSFLDS